MTQLLASSAKTRTSPRGCAMIIKFASAATPLSAVEVRVQMQTEAHRHSTYLQASIWIGAV